MNLAQRRSRENRVPYHVENKQFGETIAREIAAKHKKANQWVRCEPALLGKLVLFVNGGHGPLWLRHYFGDAQALDGHGPLTEIDPFGAIVLGPSCVRSHPCVDDGGPGGPDCGVTFHNGADAAAAHPGCQASMPGAAPASTAPPRIADQEA
jgi:hypothetical protein